MRSRAQDLSALFFHLSWIFSLTFALGIGIVRAFLVPFMGWAMNDSWQWEPFNSWLRFVIGGACVGVMAGSFFTLHAWLQQTRASLPRKTLTALAVLGATFVFMFAAAVALRSLLPLG